MVMSTTSATVPKIIGKTPAFAASNMPSEVPPKMNRSDICAAPFHAILPRMSATIATMENVIRPVAPVSRSDCQSMCLRRRGMASVLSFQPLLQPVHHHVTDDVRSKRHGKQQRAKQEQDSVMIAAEDDLGQFRCDGSGQRPAGIED